jgi:hypothetical protein
LKERAGTTRKHGQKKLYDHDANIYEVFKRLCEPTIILHMSNAPIYEAEDRIRIIVKETDNIKRGVEIDRLAMIVARSLW